MKHSLLIAAIAASTLSLTANAALEMRGQNMVYDTVLDITWLLDANHAATSGYAAANATTNNYSSTRINADGSMGWDAAKAWAAQLTITDATYGSVSGWRLASARLQTPVNYSYSPNGSTDYGYNITRSELGHMFFNNLGNKAYVDINDNNQSGYGVTNSTYTDANGSISIQNLQNAYYWNDEAYARYSNDAWAFTLGYGYQDGTNKGVTYFAWAVREGDVASEVPLPAAAWLFGVALASLVGVRRRK